MAESEMAGKALELVAAERYRQIEVEGWTTEHDDQHDDEELAGAAACYAMSKFQRENLVPEGVDLGLSWLWPWREEWWKPTPENRIRELSKAGALILAEIERLLRLEAKENPSGTRPD